MRCLGYVAVGDSQAGGLNDGDERMATEAGRTWLAELLAAQEAQFRYANLAVRGRLAAQIRVEQTGAALVVEPDLVTVMASINDLIPGRRS